jgi:hypothetical protein
MVCWLRLTVTFCLVDEDIHVFYVYHVFDVQSRYHLAALTTKNTKGHGRINSRRKYSRDRDDHANSQKRRSTTAAADDGGSIEDIQSSSTFSTRCGVVWRMLASTDPVAGRDIGEV